MHSAADVANQMLLKQGVIRSRRKPTREHQYGFHREKYVYALISAACVFCVGCGASVLHGVSSLLNPHALENISLSLAGDHLDILLHKTSRHPDVLLPIVNHSSQAVC